MSKVLYFYQTLQDKQLYHPRSQQSWPVSQIQPTASFCAAYELRMVFTFIKKTKTKKGEKGEGGGDRDSL